MSASSLRCGCQAPHCRIEAAASTITPGQPALLRLPPYFLHHANMTPTGHCLVVDTRVEMITHLNTTHADGEWGEGEVIDIEVHFTAPVVLVGLAAGREGVFFGTGGAGMSLVLDVVRKESSNTVILTRAPPDQPATPPPRHSATPPLHHSATPPLRHSVIPPRYHPHHPTECGRGCHCHQSEQSRGGLTATDTNSQIDGYVL